MTETEKARIEHALSLVTQVHASLRARLEKADLAKMTTAIFTEGIEAAALDDAITELRISLNKLV